jgi:hypothetical protein
MLDYLKAFLLVKGKGQGLVEYAILIILIAAVAYVVVAGLTGKITSLYGGISLAK